MATGASDNLFFRGVYEGCLGGCDGGIGRRPYHRNCKCALHKSRDQCPHGLTKSKVSYPLQRSWSEGCNLSLMASAQSSPSSSPAMSSLGRSRFGSYNNLADEGNDVSNSSKV